MVKVGVAVPFKHLDFILVQLYKLERIIPFKFAILKCRYAPIDRYDPLEYWQKRWNCLGSFGFARFCSRSIALIAVVGIGCLPGWLTCPGNQYGPQKKELFNLRDLTNLDNRPRITVHLWLKCSSMDLENMKESSKKTSSDCQLSVDWIMSITR